MHAFHHPHNDVRGPESTRIVFMAKIRECKVTRTNRSEKQRFDGEDAKMITKIEKSTFKAV